MNFFSGSIIIQNCIICDNVTLEEKCELKDCIVGTDQTIHGMGLYKHFKFRIIIPKLINYIYVTCKLNFFSYILIAKFSGEAIRSMNAGFDL